MSDETGTTNTVKINPATGATNIDVQDPLPETNWFWRRVYTFILSLVSVAFIWYGMESLYVMKEPEAMFRLTCYMIGVHVLLITFYMVAPSAEQMVKLIQAAKLLQAGIPITRRAVTETPQGGRSEVSTTAGGIVPPEPPFTPPAAPEGLEDDVAPRSRS